MQQVKKQSIAIPFILSVFIALVLMLLPVPQWLFYFWPNWMALVLLYWAMMHPNRVGPMVALLVSLLLEVLFVSHFGVIGAGLVVVVFFVNRIQAQLRAMSVWQQAIVMALLIGVFKLLTGWLTGMVSDFIISVEYWYSLITNFLIWPFLVILLNLLKQE